jgi:hypothetical protein
VTIHEASVGATVEWYTPASLFDALGIGPAAPDPEPMGWMRAGHIEFDLDPAAAPEGHGHVPARWFMRPPSDGTEMRWFGHVWLNPPYGPAGLPFIDRMIEHRDGLLLLPSRTETAAYQRCLIAADAVCLLRDRLWFTRSDGYTGRSSFGSTLFAFGEWAAAILIRADLGWTRCDPPSRGTMVATIEWIGAGLTPPPTDVDAVPRGNVAP